jgi:hypothetical protein
MARRKGLKLLRSDTGPVDPNHYWARAPRKRCPQCGRKIRGPNHKLGH